MSSFRLPLLLGALLLSACETEREIYVLTSTGRILAFDSGRPDKIDTTVSVRGLPSGESLVQIDYRPATGTYYCLTSEERLCTVNPVTGSVALVSSAKFTTDNLVGPVIDFNPVMDLLRVIAAEQNLRVNPASAQLTATDTVLKYDNGDVNDDKEPRLAAIAYDENRRDARSTTLYGLDITTQSLVRIGSKGGAPVAPGTGRLFTVAKLGAEFTANAGFDIEPDGDRAWGALAPNGAGAALYRIDLSDGSTDRIKEIDDGDVTVIDLVVGPKKTNGGSPS